MATDFRDDEGFSLVGASCSFQLCQERDFLPFRCDRCSGQFCLRHVAPKEHECPEWDEEAEAMKLDGARALVCPRCKDSVKYMNGPGAVEAAWAAHEAVCTGKAADVDRCPAPGCMKALTTSGSVICPSCRRRVCLKHRYEDLHPCRQLGLGAGRTVAPVSFVGSGVAPSAAPRGDWLDRLESQSRGGAGGQAKKPPSKAAEVSAQTVAERAIADFVSQIAKADPPARADCVATLSKLLNNVLANPGETKFRSLKRSNRTLEQKVFTVAGSEGLLLASGWASTEEGFALPLDADLNRTRTALRKLAELQV